jgi:hypothetical protein
MSRPVLVIVSLLSCLLVPAAWSAEIYVPPGDGTLAAAVAGASAGDTLLLRDGTFGGNVTVDKSLTLRSVNRGTMAAITGDLTVHGSSVRVTVQGLKFSKYLVVNGTIAELRVLENYFAGFGINIYSKIGASSAVQDAAPAAVIVGNQFAGAHIYENNSYDSGAFYVAGNTISDSAITLRDSAWIVGNIINNPHSSLTPILILGGSWHRILANRVLFRLINDCTYDPNGKYTGIYVNSDYILIADNVVELADFCRNQSVQRGIRSQGSGLAVIIDNVIRGVSENPNRIGWAIDSSTSASRISGNIILDYASGNGGPITSSSASADISNNLCYRNSGDCPAGNGNLNADPKFIDLLDYRLAADSPAIDAGPADYEYADLDRTRNDMGVHGGPWDIGQYDAQRNPSNVTPYVYPLTTAGWFPGSGTSGSLEVRALGVARLR